MTSHWLNRSRKASKSLRDVGSSARLAQLSGGATEQAAEFPKGETARVHRNIPELQHLSTRVCMYIHMYIRLHDAVS